ncbi:ShlB/FhaC/HecB family hemolysin secretion/activation protein [Leptolyngbya cf. ectocarpi LEGE 11479]|uniref:ShlB/FhaC/HecB family hemolysin secretion/activation protein n=1 Tax=Leptolyngbya cf. ectocarpi LEGE 11479 TaxID=1828722 RepID=A0A929FCS8_LEPEC|nr:ShlB/FhaC/HecB family hemolysin secretion/activation protein [Leptolyngbya ectocarpi]MBE9070372.1 ShlB/FhaC/HecB family hemolysin secretion/activation protein [Leptolyngbya cf. ectocarpi LEGE 11479]
MLVHSPRLVIALLSCLAIVSYGAPAKAQIPALPNLPDVPSPEEESLPSQEVLPEREPALPDETPLQIEQLPPDDVTGEITDVLDLEVCPPLADTSDVSFLATDIDVVGNTVLQTQIAEQVACYLGQEIQLSDLFNLRSRITKLYLDAGYITSGAFVPNNQDLTSGRVQIQVIEGEIEELQINGLTRLRQSYVRERLERAMATPFNQKDLERGLQLLQIDPVLARVNAELTAGNGPGKSLLILDLQEAETFHLSFSTDNYRSPSIGSAGVNLGLNISHPLGIGDSLTASYGITDGLNLYDATYSVPVNANNGTLRFRASNSDSEIVQDAFRDVGIRSETTTLSAGFRQPLVRKPAEEFALGLDFEWKRSRSFILDDIPFSFSLGPEEGRSQVSAVRFYQDWVKRSQSRVLAARSQFSVGLDILDATTNDSGIDGRFVSWLGQFQWIEQVSPKFLLLTRVGAQLTPDALLPIERFSLGGVGTVRGYSQNQLVADNAITGSVEFRIPVTKDPNKLQLTPFLEAGLGWNNQIPDPDPSFLASIGLGARWAVSPDLSVRLDYGIPLVDADDTGISLQENGLYFLVDYRPSF